ncbi:MCE family protein [Cellvibrio sp. KY-GH-1]|uniref:MlaD family protein n=1 Tax=Cellvibrio sp. KY-GH-1 TaxID=2303332 RepID=UPI0012453688|nr:MlaD family protein [Cellvibrio sp. KY-GH-1]QEY15845.1 MCE family protein [Cellvibrio sp. KY-GH-1]
MSKPRSVVIGAFIVGALLLVFIALLFFSGGQLFSHKERVIMYFEGSVQGLQIGAPIKLKGVVLGEITDIQINFQSDDKNILTAVTAELALQRINRKGANVDQEFFEGAIQRGLRAQLNFQSFLTGLLYVELDFFPNMPAHLYGFQNDVLELPTVGTEFEEISKNLQDLNIKGVINNLEKLSANIAKLVESGTVEKTLGSVKTAADAIDQTAISFRTDINAISQELTKTSSELNTLLITLNTQAPAISLNLNNTLTQLQQSLAQFNDTAQTLDTTFAEDSPLVYQLNRTLKDVSRSANALRDLSDTLEEQPESLLRGKHTLEEN